MHNSSEQREPEPQGNDLQIADRFQAAVFTFTNRGMFVYDPMSKEDEKGPQWTGVVATVEQAAQQSDACANLNVESSYDAL